MFDEKMVAEENDALCIKLTAVPGPWNREPNREEFKHSGFDCLLQRSGGGGHWCGYVAVTPNHLWSGRSYSGLDIDVHGGLTYSEGCAGKICHRSEGDDKVWWFGFDCGHAWDLSPLDSWGRSGAYRDINYVREQTKLLAEQLAKIV